LSELLASNWTSGLSLAALILYLHRSLDTRIAGVERGQAELRECMARLEGAVQGFMAGQRYDNRP